MKPKIIKTDKEGSRGILQDRYWSWELESPALSDRNWLKWSVRQGKSPEIDPEKILCDPEDPRGTQLSRRWLLFQSLSGTPSRCNQESNWNEIVNQCTMKWKNPEEVFKDPKDRGYECCDQTIEGSWQSSSTLMGANEGRLYSPSPRWNGLISKDPDRGHDPEDPWRVSMDGRSTAFLSIVIDSIAGIVGKWYNDPESVE